MANRQFRSQFQYGFEGMVVELYAHVTYGATGAVTLDTANSKGIASVSRTSPGLYVITLQDKYNKLLHFDVAQLSTGAMAAPIVNLKAQTVSSNKTLTFQYLAINNSSATDPADTEQAFIKITLGNSSV
jgi:hypothetical protein